MSKPWKSGRESAEDLLDPLVGILKYVGAHPEVRPDDIMNLLAETKAEPMPFGASGTSFTMEEWLEHDPRAEEYPIRLFLRAFRYGVEQGRRLTASMGAVQVFKLFDNFINIWHGTKKGDLAGAIKEAVEALQKVEARKLSLADVQDLVEYIKKYAPKKLQGGEAQTQLEALREELNDLVKQHTSINRGNSPIIPPLREKDEALKALTSVYWLIKEWVIQANQAGAKNAGALEKAKDNLTKLTEEFRRL